MRLTKSVRNANVEGELAPCTLHPSNSLEEDRKMKLYLFIISVISIALGAKMIARCYASTDLGLAVFCIGIGLIGGMMSATIH